MNFFFFFSRLIRKLIARLITANFQINSKKNLIIKDEYGDYAITKDLPVNECITFGVGNNINFEIQLQNIFPDVKFQLIDPVIDVDKNLLKKSEYINSILVPIKAVNKFYTRTKLDHSSYKYEESDLGECISTINFDKISIENDFTILKFDIEGSEFSLIEDFSSLLKNFYIKQVLIEIHWDYKSISLIKNFIKINRVFINNGFKNSWISNYGKEFLYVRT